MQLRACSRGVGPGSWLRLWSFHLWFVFDRIFHPWRFLFCLGRLALRRNFFLFCRSRIMSYFVFFDKFLPQSSRRRSTSLCWAINFYWNFSFKTLCHYWATLRFYHLTISWSFCFWFVVNLWQLITKHLISRLFLWAV